MTDTTTDTLANYIATQNSLLQEAAAALPHSFSQCTYARGPIRQAVYLCTTCAVPRGLCSACSVACHTQHEQLELFPKRAFRCDCPTHALDHACTLHSTLEDVNEGNTYGQNFKGLFCRCSREYDALNERETMIQCLACEDWYHESCLNLRERPAPVDDDPPAPVPEAENQPATDADDAQSSSSASSSGLPPPLLPGTAYDALLCAACVARIPVLARYAGTPGTRMIVRHARDAPWRVLDGSDADAPVEVDAPADEDAPTGSKRALPHADGGVGAKRPRLSPPADADAKHRCLAPQTNVIAQDVLKDPAHVRGQGDLFLVDDWRARWCRCETCLPALQAHPFLLEEEETYEPPDDPDSQLSLEELGMRALERLPRDRALDGVRAFNNMRDDLVQFLRPFAEGGTVVAEADIRAFFEEKRAAEAGSL